MNPKTRFFPQAQADLVDQAAYLADHGSTATSERFLTAVRATAESLAEMPTKGRRWISARLESHGEIRVWKVKGFPKILLFYRVDPEGISVVRVLHGARDLPAHLDGHV